MTDTITLYAHKHASRAERCLWALDELALTYTLRRLDVSAGETMHPEFRKISPDGKLPALTHGERPMTESMPICEYLARLNPDAGLLPVSIDEQYHYGRLMHYLLTEVEMYLWVKAQAGFLKQLYPWPDGTSAFARGMAEKHINGIESLMGPDGFASCGRFTIADILLTQLLGWADASRVAVPDTLIDYRMRMLGRKQCPQIMQPSSA
ncbi:MAG: glutathione S-transferase family protein [Pseudomonadota bacterium]